MSVHTSKNGALGRLLRDAVVASLLVLALVGVYAWDQTHQETQVASGHQTPNLLDPGFGDTEPSATSAPDSPAGSNTKSDVGATSPTTKEPAEPTGAQTSEPVRDFVARGNKLATPPPPPKPEPLPIVAQKLLSQSNLNRFGNPEGKGLGLAQANEFVGARMLVWSTDSEAHNNVFTTDNPLWAAIKDLGFEIQMKRTRFETQWLDDADQLWIFSGHTSGMDAKAYAAVVDFVQSGKGVYLAAENAPYFVEATELTRRLYQTDISGDYPGGNLIAVRGYGVTRDDFRKLGQDADPQQKQDPSGRGGKSDSKSRIEIINRATHYADLHPLLTDVNFIFEGITVSHIEPTSRLQTVLLAFDRQILAAVSLDPGQRVVVDCGWTRYYFSSQGRFVTDTAGTIRYAENIAAYLMGKDDKRQGGGQWLERKKLLEKYRNAPPNDLVAAFRDTDVAERLAAVTMAVRRKLDIPSALIQLIRDADRDVRRQARSALRGLAGVGIDYGPSENANQGECDLSSQHWSGWLRRKQLLAKFEALSPNLVVAAMVSNDPEERWAAVSAAVSRRLDIPDALIGLLADAEPEIRQLARKALVQLAGKFDFGPAPDANQAATNTAILDWKRWLRRKQLLAKFVALPPDLVVAAMVSNDPEERWAAVSAAIPQRLDVPDKLIGLLADAEPEIRQLARQALVQLAGRFDFGPAPNANQAATNAAILDWKRWRVLKKFPDVSNADQDLLIDAMKSDDAERRWATVIVVHQKKLRLNSNLIDLLGDPEKLVQQEARLTLIQIAKGVDHGPNEDASAEEVAKSAQQWTEWFQREFEKTATQKLQLAKQLLKSKPDVARQRLKEITDQFPGTAAAKEATSLLRRP